MKASCRDLGLMDYKTCWDLQQELFDGLMERKRAAKTTKTQATGADNAGSGFVPGADDGSVPAPGTDDPENAGTVLLVEHPPVYTLGKSGRAENLLIAREALEGMGAQFFHIDRGGDITFHGPGQLVCYPILDLERIGIGPRSRIG